MAQGNPNGGLSKRGLGPKGANWAKKGPFGAISPLPPWRWGAEESVPIGPEKVPIGPEKAPIGPEKAPICPEKARFSRKDFPLIFSENLGLKPPFVSPPLDFPKWPQLLLQRGTWKRYPYEAWCPQRRSRNATLLKDFIIKNLLTPLFLMGCFPVDFQEVKRPLRTKSVKRPIKVGKRPINE